MKPEFSPGKNIAVKTPTHEYDAVVAFYRDILGLPELPMQDADLFESMCFDFGDKVLWIDKIDGISQSEIWLEIVTRDLEAAQRYLLDSGCVIRNEIERLPAKVNGFWLNSPANVIHLVTDQP